MKAILALLALIGVYVLATKIAPLAILSMSGIVFLVVAVLMFVVLLAAANA